jgi:hypothetical protein
MDPRSSSSSQALETLTNEGLDSEEERLWAVEDSAIPAQMDGKAKNISAEHLRVL